MLVLCSSPDCLLAPLPHDTSSRLVGLLLAEGACEWKRGAPTPPAAPADALASTAVVAAAAAPAPVVEGGRGSSGLLLGDLRPRAGCSHCMALPCPVASLAPSTALIAAAAAAADVARLGQLP